MTRRNLVGIQVVLPDKCRWCHTQDVARAAVANMRAEGNFQACRYKLLCVESRCSGFRGYVSKELEQHLEKVRSEPQPIRLGVRTKKKTNGDGTRTPPMNLSRDRNKA